MRCACLSIVSVAAVWSEEIFANQKSQLRVCTKVIFSADLARWVGLWENCRGNLGKSVNQLPKQSPQSVLIEKSLSFHWVSKLTSMQIARMQVHYLLILSSAKAFANLFQWFIKKFSCPTSKSVWIISVSHRHDWWILWNTQKKVRLLGKMSRIYSIKVCCSLSVFMRVKFDLPQKQISSLHKVEGLPEFLSSMIEAFILSLSIKFNRAIQLLSL